MEQTLGNVKWNSSVSSPMWTLTSCNNAISTSPRCSPLLSALRPHELVLSPGPSPLPPITHCLILEWLLIYLCLHFYFCFTRWLVCDYIQYYYSVTSTTNIYLQSMCSPLIIVLNTLPVSLLLKLTYMWNLKRKMIETNLYTKQK